MIDRAKKQKGLWRDDPFLSYINGYSELERVAQNGMELYIEVDRIQHALFPLREKPVLDHPGYVTHECDYFEINFSNPEIKRDLEEYFLEKYSRLRNGLFNSYYSLGGFFEMICHQILVSGKSYNAISWDSIEINKQKYVLPVAFRSLRASTMHILNQGYKQKFSLITYILEKGFKDYENTKKPRVYYFNQDEILFCKYPFFNQSPTKQSLKYLPTIKNFWEFGVNQSKSNVEVTNHYLPLEKARYTTYQKEKRKYDLARNRIRTIFNYLLEPEGSRITQYYDVYTVIRYKKYLNDLRNYLIDEFNKQIFQPVAVKNNWIEIPKLTMSGFLTNIELELAFKNYTEEKMTFDEMIEKIVKKD